MTVTEKLLRLFRVDEQLDGLQSRLRAAQKFLDEQSRQGDTLAAQLKTQQAGLKQAQAQALEQESQAKAFDARIEKLRDQMNSAKTNKEYQAFLVEINTIKADKDEVEKSALELMTKADELKKQVDDLEAKLAERQRVRSVAATERDQREHEIRDRLNELRAERAKLALEVPKDALAVYEELLIKRGGQDVMAPVEEQDRKRHEITCGSCMMSVPVETLSTLLTGNKLIRCVSCGCILYMDKELAAAMQPAASKR